MTPPPARKGPDLFARPALSAKERQKVNTTDLPAQPLEELSVAELERAIEYHDYQYHVLAQPLISDEKYDLLHRRLEQLAPDSTVLHRVGGGFSNTGFRNKVTHASPMLSLDKCYDAEKYLGWLTNLVGRALTDARQIPGKLLVTVSPKVDGVAASLQYDEQGKLVQAATRGDGTQGEDFTVNARLIPDIPWQVASGPLEVRGEIYMRRSVFQARYAASFPNPRNLTAGTLKQKESNRSQLLDLSFFAYDLLGLPITSEVAKGQQLRELGFVPVAATLVAADQAPQEFEQAIADREQWDFDADGMVVRLNDVALQESLGATAHHPRYAIAFKFQGDEGITRLQAIEWSVSRSAIITPVALVEPIFLSGAQVARSTLHNLAEFAKLDLHRGDRVRLKRRGDVIPKVEGNLGGGQDAYAIPLVCPSCDNPTMLAAPNLFVAGFRFQRFGDGEQLRALVEHLAGEASKIKPPRSDGLFDSALGTHNTLARRGDLRFREALTWGRNETDKRRAVLELTRGLPRLAPAGAVLEGLFVLDPAIPYALEMLDWVLAQLAPCQLALTLIVVPDSRLQSTDDHPNYDRLVAAGVAGTFFAALSELLPSQSLPHSLKQRNGNFAGPFLAQLPALAQALAEDVLVCSRPEVCRLTQLGRLEHFIQTLGVDGFGARIIETLYDRELLQTPVDFFGLEARDLVALERMGDILAGKLIANVQSARHLPLNRFLQALGIEELARHVATLLEREYGSLDAVLALREADLVAHDSIAFAIAHQVVHGLRRAGPLIESLRQFITIDAPVPEASDGPLSGQSFVFTGKMRTLQRKAAQERVVALGGLAPPSVTTELTHLVVGDEGSPLFGEGVRGSKMKKAEKYNQQGAAIAIISETDFLKLLENTGGGHSL
jgi:NAD-dependent DNA ligase